MGRPTKRARLSNQDVAPESKTWQAEVASLTPDKHEIFMGWATDRGVQINGVKPTKFTNAGFGLATTKAIAKDERILFVPEPAMYKPNVQFLKRQRLSNASPQAQLAVSAMAAFGPDNDLAIWQRTWPTNQDLESDLPLCWSRDDQKRLPAGASQVLDRQKHDYQNDWQAVQAYCEAAGRTEEDFRYYWMIVNSRSFHWKPSRGNKPSSMVMCPFVDYMNHGPSGTTCHVYQTPEGYEVVADKEYAPGQEVIATYGAHSNDKLLVHYGFVLEEDTDDSISLDHIMLPALNDSTKTQLQDVGFLGGYYLMPGSNDIEFRTQVAVRAALQTANEWEYFISNGEDLTNDHSKAVRRWLRPLLQEVHNDAGRHCKALRKRDTGMLMLLRRWEQTKQALQAFMKE